MSRPAVIVAALALSAALLMLGDAPLSAQVTPPAGEKIGQVTFPVSCAPAMQKPFERAVALLHSFWITGESGPDIEVHSQMLVL